uniref:Uncharacterized protein n=1 Tax=Arundo donax TaxID=35708 RepID=A0A0A9FPT6_ARUDO
METCHTTYGQNCLDVTCDMFLHAYIMYKVGILTRPAKARSKNAKEMPRRWCFKIYS